MISFRVLGVPELVAALGAAEGRVRAGLVRAVLQLGLALERKVKAEKLSGQVLKVKTGTLRRSITTRSEETPTGAGAFVGTNIGYGRVHELGVSHSWLITAKRAKALRFEIDGEEIFRHSVVHPLVPERSFLRSALHEMEPQALEEIGAAVKAALKA